MLVVANGAYKSGSTWMRNIVLRMSSYQPIPESYQHPLFSNWINPDRVPAFLAEVDCENHDYITKSHFYEQRDVGALLSSPHVRIINIERDIRDVIVSHYFHMLREKKTFGGFRFYYWTLGRYKVRQMTLYHAAWPQDDRILKLRFEELVADFPAEVRKIAQFLGFRIGPKKLEKIRQATTLEAQQRRRGEDELAEEDRFFRKGVVGDWRNHMTPAIEADIERVSGQGFGPVNRFVYYLLFDVRNDVKRYFLTRSKRITRLLQRV